MYELGISLCIVEALIILWIIYRIIKTTNLELKDTSVYPILFIIHEVIYITSFMVIGNAPFLDTVLSSFKPSLKLLTLEFDNNLLTLLQGDYQTLFVAYKLLCWTSLLAFISLLCSIFKVHFVNFVWRIFINIKIPAFFKKEKTYVDGLFGFNDSTKTYIDGLTKKEKRKTIVYLSKQEIQEKHQSLKAIKGYLYSKHVAFSMANYDKKGFESKTHLKCKYNFISFIGDDDGVYKFATEALEYAKVHSNIQFTIFAERNQNHFLKSIMSASNGFVRVFDKYELNGYVFSAENNFAKYIRQADPSIINKDLTINDCDINLFLFGFGKTNKQILEKSLIANQFVTLKNGKLEPKRINTYVYDLNPKIESLLLSTGLLFYKKDTYIKHQEDYFALTNDYQNIEFALDTNIYDKEVIQKLFSKDIKDNKKSFNFFVIAIGDDFKNLAFADKLQKLLDGNNKSHNFIFIRTKKNMIDANIHDNMYLFGNDSKILTRKNIVLEGIFDQCIKRNYFYKYKKEFSKASEEDIENAKKEWSKLSELKRESNLSSICSIDFKLSLLGYDSTSSDFKKYNELYFGQEEKPSIKYDINEYNIAKDNVKKYTPRDVLAFSEHERWIAFELSQSVLPLSKKEFLKLKVNQTPSGNKHANICTSFGLKEYYDFMHQHKLNVIDKDGNDNADVIRYDYELMDNYEDLSKYIK